MDLKTNHQDGRFQLGTLLIRHRHDIDEITLCGPIDCLDIHGRECLLINGQSSVPLSPTSIVLHGHCNEFYFANPPARYAETTKEGFLRIWVKESEKESEEKHRPRRIAEFDSVIDEQETDSELDDDSDDAPYTPDAMLDSIVDSLREVVLGANDISGDCAICQEDYIMGDKINYMTCAHRFHSHCIQRWLRRSPLCPICKIDVLEADAKYKRIN